jgi:hypothetical protein
VCAAISLVAGLILVIPAVAQTDPLVGTWQLNVSKSKYAPGPPAKEQTITYAAVANGLKATVSGVDGNGNKMAYAHTASHAAACIEGGACRARVGVRSNLSSFSVRVTDSS